MPRLFLRLTFASGLAAAALAGNPAIAQSGADRAKLLAQADTNGDGRVTQSEAEVSRNAVFAKMDRNEDGYVDRSDRPNLIGRGRFDKVFNALMPSMDINGDEMISRSEFDSSQAARFQGSDSNGGGQLDRAEIDQIVKR